MEMRRLGSQGPEISVIGYGAWEAGGVGWGPDVSDDRVLDAIHAGLDAGVTWVDTAETYGDGRSEELVGRAVPAGPDVLVFTKVASAPRGSGYRPHEVRRAAEASLRRLGRDSLDLYQLHWPDERSAPLEDTWGAMGDLVDAGLVRWIGVSNFAAEAMERCERIRHVDSLQPQVSMLWQERLPLLEACRSNGTGVIAYGPLAYGLLTGSITTETRFGPDDWRSGGLGLRAYGQLFAPGRLEANLRVVEALQPIATRGGHTVSQLALAWVLHQDGVTGAIAGSRSAAHVVENAAASSVRLSKEELAEIDGILGKRGELTTVGE
jgi:aryl-alcohol dehydrogenase-like predicted oxidoreductase